MAQQQTTVNTSQQGLIGMPQQQIITTPVMSMNSMGHQVKPDGNMPSLVNVQTFVGNNIQQQAQQAQVNQQTQNQQQQQQQMQQSQVQTTLQQQQQQQQVQQQQQQQQVQQQVQQQQQPTQPQVVGSNGVNVPVAPVNSLQQQFTTGTPSKGNASTTASAPNPPVGATQPTSDDPQKLLSKPRLMELVKDVDPTVQLDDEVEEMLLSIADNFVDSIANGSCKIAKHRHMQTVEVRDVQLYLEQAYNIWIPGLGTDELRPYKRSAITEAHKQRMALIRKAKK